MTRLLFLPVVLLCLSTYAEPPSATGDSVEDTVFLQEVGAQIATGTPVTAVCVAYDEPTGTETIFVGTKDGLQEVRDGVLVPVEDVPSVPVKQLHAWTFGFGPRQDVVHCITRDGIWTRVKGTWQLSAEGDFNDVGGGLFATERVLYEANGEGVTRLHEGESPLPIEAVARHDNTIYCLAPDRLFLFDGKRYLYGSDVIEFGALPSKDCRDLLSMDNQLIVATHYGLGVIRGTAATTLLAGDGLPWEECHQLARGFDGDYWIGTTRGAIRATKDGEFHYFTAPRWMPDNAVNGVGAGVRTVAIATDKGLGIITYVPYTLAKKAAYYEQHLDVWGQKRMVFTHKIEWNGEDQTWRREVSDNDVGWSTHFWAAMAFKYAATGDESARRAAIEGFNCLKWSEEISSIDGFPARSIWAVGETGNKATGGSGGYPAEWHPTEDGLWEWKGDTSSDEIDAHFYCTRVFYDLVADDALKEEVREHVSRIADHIIDSGWTLRDVDGNPTVWGRWDLGYFNSMRGVHARGLNGLEALTYIDVARDMTREPRFDGAFRWLIDHDYLKWSINQKLVAVPQIVNHSDDRLAFYCYYAFNPYADRYVAGYYQRGLARSWAIERIEHNPWFNFIYSVRSHAPSETKQSVNHLRAWPLDLVQHHWNFKHRRDLDPPKDYLPYAFGEKAVSPRERGGYRWPDDPFELEGGNGHTVIDPAGWLDAYWMGRYYGFITPPQTDDPDLIDVPPPPADYHPGAAPYDGPPMPWVLRVEKGW